MEQKMLTEDELLAGLKSYGPPVACREDRRRSPLPPSSPKSGTKKNPADEKDIGSPTSPGSFDAIIEAVCRKFEVSKTELLGPRRFRDLVTPRYVAMYLMRITKKRSLSFIGQRLGGRDHATVLYGLRKMDDLLLEDAQLFAQVNELHVELTRTPLPNPRNF